MTSPARRAEAAQASSTFHVAMAMIGAQAFGESLRMWDDVVPTSTRAASTGVKFVEAAIKLLRLRRHQVQAIVIPYLRLTRALHTGYTFQPVWGAEPDEITLNKLRQDFVEAVRRFAPDALSTAEVGDEYDGDKVDDSFVVEMPDGGQYRPYAGTGNDDSVITEELDRLQELLDETEAAAEAEAQAVLDALAKDLLEEKLKKLEVEQLTAQEADRRQEDEHGVVGRRVAAHVERMTQNGGRHTEDVIARRDPRAIGFVRVHYPKGDPEPCSFCAMLISRGIVYRSGRKDPDSKVPMGTSERRSTRDNERWQMWRKGFDVPGAEFDKYHPLCHCRGEAVYSAEQYDEDGRFQVNRELDQLWQDEIAKKGYRAKEAESQWRIIINARNQRPRQERGAKEHSHA